MFHAGLHGQTCGSASERRFTAKSTPTATVRLWGFLCPGSMKEQTMSRHITVVVDSIRLLAAEPGANVRALADITIDNQLHLRDLRVVQNQGQSPYVQPPLVRTIRPDGTPHYTFKATWEPTLHEAIAAAVMDAYKVAKRDALIGASKATKGAKR